LLRNSSLSEQQFSRFCKRNAAIAVVQLQDADLAVGLRDNDSAIGD
jgi:hypothetical protein